MSIAHRIADVAPEPTFPLGGTGAALAVVVVVVVAVALLVWRLRNRPAEKTEHSKPAQGPSKIDTSKPAPAPSTTAGGPPKAAADEPPFDAEKAIGLCGDDEDLLRSVIEELPAEIDSQMQILHDALKAEDTGTLHVAAHRLKGSLLLIAAGPSAALALSIELAGRQSKLAEVPPALGQLDAEVLRLKGAIADYLGAGASS